MIRKDTLFQIFFTIAFMGMLYETFILLEPLLTPLLMALILWLLALPVDDYYVRRWPHLAHSTRALVSTLTVLLIFIVPLSLLFWLFLNEFQDVVPRLQTNFEQAKLWLQNPPIENWACFHRLEAWHHHLPWIPRPDLKNRFMGWAGSLLARMTAVGGSLAATVTVFFFYMAVILLALFFFFSEGRRWYAALLDLIPLRMEHKKRIFRTFRESIANIARGSLITSMFQMVTAIVGYWIVGVDAAIILGLATGVASFLPIVGSAVIWFPMAIFFAVKGVWWKSIFLVLWGTFLIALTDNVIRTYFIGAAEEMPLFFMFLGLIGGLAVYGAPGLVIGPLVVAILPVFIDIYKEMYLHHE